MRRALIALAVPLTLQACTDHGPCELIATHAVSLAVLDSVTGAPVADGLSITVRTYRISGRGTVAISDYVVNPTTPPALFGVGDYLYIPGGHGLYTLTASAPGYRTNALSIKVEPFSDRECGTAETASATVRLQRLPPSQD
jgi:hypothetical protein